MFILAIDLARFPIDLHKFTQALNDNWQEILKKYLENEQLESEKTRRTIDFILSHYFFRNEKDGYKVGFDKIAHLEFPERKDFMALAIDSYFEAILEYTEIVFEDGLDHWLPDRQTILAHLDLYVSWAMELPENAKGRVTKEQFNQWKKAYFDWFDANSSKIPKKYRMIEKINMEELFEEFEYYAV